MKILKSCSCVIVGAAICGLAPGCNDSVPAGQDSCSLIDRASLGMSRLFGPRAEIDSEGVVSFPEEILELAHESRTVQSTTRYDSTGWLGVGRSYVVL